MQALGSGRIYTDGKVSHVIDTDNRINMIKAKSDLGITSV